MAGSIDVHRLIRQIPSHYPFVLVDRVLDFDPSGKLTAIKNVTGSEEFFEGHFPGAPVMPGVLIMEGLAQAAGVWLLKDAPDPSCLEIYMLGIDSAKFRKPVLPGDQLLMEIQVLRRHGPLCQVRGEVTAAGQRVAEATLLLQVRPAQAVDVDPTARVHPSATLGPGARVGPYSIIGAGVEIGPGTIIDSHVVIDGPTTIGAQNHIFPYSSIGLIPQDLKYHGGRTHLAIGDQNVFREFVTVHRGTEGGGGITRVGSHNLFMAYVHIAHDCVVGDHTIFGNAATLAGHVVVHDHATVNAFSAVHQFCRVGEHSYLGGFTVATQDVLPFSKTVGNRARIYGMNTIGLVRRGFSKERIAVIRKAYRILLQSRLNTRDALARIEAEGLDHPDVRLLVDFIHSAKRGVVLKRGSRRLAADDNRGEP